MCTRTLDSEVLIWRTQPYLSSVRIICISQLISMSTPRIWFEAKGGRRRSTALEAGSNTTSLQSSPGQERSQPSGGKQVRVGSRVEDPTAQRCPEGPLNLEVQQAPSYRKSLLRLGAPEPRTIVEEAGDAWGKALAELQANHTRSSPTLLRPSDLIVSLAFIQLCPPTVFSQQSMAFPGFYPSQRFGLQLTAGLPGARIAFENFD